MKLIDGNSKMGIKLEKLLIHNEKEIERLKQKNLRRNLLPPADAPETKLEKKIKQWFTAAEEGERPFIIVESYRPRQRKILVLTYFRAILFEAGLFGRLKDVSDKVWRQFVAVHLIEETYSCSLKLRFFKCHDPVLYYNPYKENSALEESDFKNWRLDRLNKDEAKKVYSFLKDKEMYWQEERRKESINHQKTFVKSMLMAKPPGGSDAQPTKEDSTAAK